MQHGHRHEDLVAELDAARPWAREEAGPADVRFDQSRFTAAVRNLALSFEPHRVPARNVIATARFFGKPGREHDAAEAWAFELTYFFLRGVGEQPAVEYEDGIYTVTGMMTTTHPGDRAVTNFTRELPWDLDFATATWRQTVLRDAYTERALPRFDGREGR